MNEWVNQLMDQYYDFLKGRTAIVSDTGTNWTAISTPFSGLFNDNIEIYVFKSNEGKISLSDDGATLNNLELFGSPISKSPNRKKILEKVLLNYGVSCNNENELVVDATEATFPQKKHNLISAISEINDMYMLAKHTVASVFKEDVQLFLDEQEIIYTPQFISKGSTGLEFTFDFQIAYKEKEIVIKSFNNINRFNLSSFLFSWDDIKSVREKITGKETVGLAVINNSQKAVSDDYLDALKSKNADYVLWDNRHTPENIAKFRKTG